MFYDEASAVRWGANADKYIDPEVKRAWSRGTECICYR
jgi:hypothetical protein